jgi:hypothetical protein
MPVAPFTFEPGEERRLAEAAKITDAEDREILDCDLARLLCAARRLRRPVSPRRSRPAAPAGW